MDQLVGIHLEVLNSISVFSFYNVNMRLKNMQKSILIKIVSITSELQEQYCKIFFFCGFGWGAKKKGIWLFPFEQRHSSERCSWGATAVWRGRGLWI